MNAFKRFGQTCVSMLVGGGLMAGALLAAGGNLVTVTLPYAVTVGSATLPSGEYTISTIDMAGNDELLVIRSEKGNLVATVQAHKSVSLTPSDKTQVILAKDGNNWNLDKLTVEGDEVAYQFVK